MKCGAFVYCQSGIQAKSRWDGNGISRGEGYSFKGRSSIASFLENLRRDRLVEALDPMDFDCPTNTSKAKTSYWLHKCT